MQYSPLFADLSSANPHFDAGEYKRSGHILVAIKATEGTSYVNPLHRGYSLRAGLEHVGVVHYHFARPDVGNRPADEAEHFLRWALPLAGPRDYLLLDLERATPQGYRHDPEWSQAFDRYVIDHSRFNTILYANKSTLQQSDNWLVNLLKRVHDADWSNDPDYAPPGYKCVFRQLTDGVIGPAPHSLPGIGECDVNRMSRQMFEATIREQP